LPKFDQVSKIRWVRYEQTHPWLTFQMRVEPSTLWAKLGEAFSKNQHLAGIPLPPKIAADLAKVVLTKGALATTAIEGNTLTESEADAIINQGHRLPESQKYLEIEIKNIVEALEQIDASGLAGQGFRLTPNWLKTQNAAILKNLETEKHVIPGEYTQSTLLVDNVYRGAPPEEIPYLIDRLCTWLNESFIAPSQDENNPQDMRFYSAMFAAILAHLYLVWIHPFGDGNGRCARLAEVAILAHSGVVPWVAANLLSDHYNRTRSRYYLKLAAASQDNDPIGFIAYAIEGYVDLLREQIGTVQQHQLRIAWYSYIHEKLRDDPPGKAKDRRRALALAFPLEDVVPKKLIRYLSHELTEQYAGHEQRMIQRDINALIQHGLVTPQEGGYRSASFIMNAFIPLVQKG